MKRLNFIILLIAFAVLVGAKGQMTGITELSIVHAVGIDKSGDEYKMTLQIFKPEAAGADTPIDISRANFKTVSASGKTAEVCMDKLSSQLGTDLFFGHLQLIVLGRDITFSNIDELFLPFKNDKSIYRETYIAAAENAGETVSFPIKENAVTAENYKGIIEKAAEHGIALKSTLSDIENSYPITHTLPITVLEITGEEDDKHLTPNGCVIMTENSVSGGQLSSDECKLISLLNKGGEVSFENDKGDIFVLINIKCRYEVKTHNGRLMIDAYVTAEVSGADSDTDDIEKALENNANTLFKELLNENGKDITGIYRYIRFYRPKIYSEYKENINNLYSLTDININISLTKKKPAG